MDMPKPGSWIKKVESQKRALKKPFVRKDHLTQRPFMDMHGILITGRKEEASE